MSLAKEAAEKVAILGPGLQKLVGDVHSTPDYGKQSVSTPTGKDKAVSNLTGVIGKLQNLKDPHGKHYSPVVKHPLTGALSGGEAVSPAAIRAEGAAKKLQELRGGIKSSKLIGYGKA